MTLIAEKWKEVLCEKWGVQLNLSYVYISGSMFKNSLSEKYSPDCFFSKDASQVCPFYHFQMLFCCLPPYCSLSLLLAWLQCKYIMKKFKLLTWTRKVPDNLALSNISIFTFHASFPPYHSLNIFTLMLPLSPLPLWLHLSCFIHLLSWRFFQSSFKIHFSEQSFLSFPT